MNLCILEYYIFQKTDHSWFESTCSGKSPDIIYGAADVKNYMTENYPVKSMSSENSMLNWFMNDVVGIDFKIDVYWIGFDGKPVFYRSINGLS